MTGGNLYDKYGTRNPVARLLMARFLGAVDRMVDRSGATDVHEVGCGEGEISLRLAARRLAVRGSDVAPAVVAEARRRAAARGLDVPFRVADVYDLEPDRDAAGLVVCLEVLEHLDDPVRALRRLASLAQPWALLSVPREPLWRAANVIRLEYLRHLGNTPGHVQHWSRRDFVRLVERHFQVVEVAAPVPWTLVLARTRG
jgi:2-polyprenyl-3-methyl-5-hydroxy-6-metoxy-1,4-benzoquinol methylase